MTPAIITIGTIPHIATLAASQPDVFALNTCGNTTLVTKTIAIVRPTNVVIIAVNPFMAFTLIILTLYLYLRINPTLLVFF